MLKIAIDPYLTKKKLKQMTQWVQYDPNNFFDVYKMKQSTTKLKIYIHKMINLTFNIKKISSVVITTYQKLKIKV